MATTESEAKLIQYLNEAYSKEKELETALEAHIPLATRATYKRRLQQHLRETKRHARDVESRIKQLGGSGTAEIAATVQAAAAKALALAQGPLHAVRARARARAPPAHGPAAALPVPPTRRRRVRADAAPGRDGTWRDYAASTAPGRE